MMALECDDDIIVIDCGVLFPDDDMPGVDLVLPDVSYLVERRSKVKAILITHGHEDHIGALPYVLPSLNVPVFAPRLAHGLISAKIKEHKLDGKVDLHIVEPGAAINLGSFQVEFFRVCHSIPDAMGLAIRTPAGLVVHMGDFKVDHTPVDGETTDLVALSRYGSEGVLLLLSDSTYAEMEGYTPSERVVEETLDRIVGNAKGRVLVATFASHIARIQQVIDAAVRHDRKVTIVGRSMINNIAMATGMGYIEVPDGTLISPKRGMRLAKDKVVILTTGSQGEPTSALVRISNRSHHQLGVSHDDTVVISASAVPGNEKAVSRTINNLSRQGARVLYDKVALVHVHGHGSREELKMMLNLTKPLFFVPVHGEYRHLKAHADLARECGVKKANIFILEDGEVLDVAQSGSFVGGRVPTGHIYVDGGSAGNINNSVLNDRRRLSQDGIVVIALSFDKASGAPLSKPEVASSGFVECHEAQDLYYEIASEIFDSLNQHGRYPSDWAYISEKVSEIASEFLYKNTGRRPMIIPVAVEVQV